MALLGSLSSYSYTMQENNRQDPCGHQCLCSCKKDAQAGDLLSSSLIRVITKLFLFCVAIAVRYAKRAVLMHITSIKVVLLSCSGRQIARMVRRRASLGGTSHMLQSYNAKEFGRETTTGTACTQFSGAYCSPKQDRGDHFFLGVTK